MWQKMLQIGSGGGGSGKHGTITGVASNQTVTIDTGLNDIHNFTWFQAGSFPTGTATTGSYNTMTYISEFSTTSYFAAGRKSGSGTAGNSHYALNSGNGNMKPDLVSIVGGVVTCKTPSVNGTGTIKWFAD